ncbi:hypothetical protein FEM48_Zijuj03G0190200 [Ziziphus jujuba var. spinosa]|uniref:Uncharacterized protein n=1 Tax=Ziziphus jujuba var. spinosa TaxID=714518 RepID=A0A978VS25_ZIZJJ|nr:hypothetical protein FEM48_Zijuj03G0190200 [Ziziphus jujuba var. spinosa]
MHQFNPKPISSYLLLFTLFALFVLSSFPTVRSEYQSSVLRFPSDDVDDNEDVCGVVSTSDPPSSCPVKCFRPDPVCGVDGVTYWCGCADARCANTKVAKLSFCESSILDGGYASSAEVHGGICSHDL